jgi:hypothetical protein
MIKIMKQPLAIKINKISTLKYGFRKKTKREKKENKNNQMLLKKAMGLLLKSLGAWT